MSKSERALRLMKLIQKKERLEGVQKKLQNLLAEEENLKKQIEKEEIFFSSNPLSSEEESLLEAFSEKN